jgi:hypothetical protein
MKRKRSSAPASVPIRGLPDVPSGMAENKFLFIDSNFTIRAHRCTSLA